MNDVISNIGLIAVASILTENFLLSKFLGICPFLGVSGKLSGSIGMGAAVIVVMVLSSSITYPIYYGLLVPLNIEFMNTIAFILIIASLVQILEAFIKKYIPPLYKGLGVYLPLIATNCAVLGVTTINIDSGYKFYEAILNALFAGIGFLLVMVMFSGVRLRLEKNNIPKALRGTPITLLAAVVVSIAFLGFGGLGN